MCEIRPEEMAGTAISCWSVSIPWQVLVKWEGWCIHLHLTGSVGNAFWPWDRQPKRSFLLCSGFSHSCSIQVFHCLKHEGTGGRTLLVDGFYAAEQVLRQAPDQFELLSKVPLKHEYVENVGDCHNHMIGVGPVLNVYPWNNELYLIR